MSFLDSFYEAPSGMAVKNTNNNEQFISSRNDIHVEASIFGGKIDDKTFRSFVSAIPPIADISMFADLIKKVTDNLSVKVADYALNVFVLLYRLYNTKSIADIIVTSIDFIRSVEGGTFVLDNLKKINTFIVENAQVFLQKLQRTMTQSVIDGTITTEGKLTDFLSSIRANIGLVLRSEVVTAIRDFILSLVSFQLFSRENSIRITKSLGPARKCTAIELADQCLTSLIAVLSFGDKLSEGCTLTEIFSSTDPAEDYKNLVTEIESNVNLTYPGLPVPGRICQRAFAAQVAKTVEDGESLIKTLIPRSPAYKTAFMAHQRLKKIHVDCQSIMNGETRSTPFGIALVGDPGIGKSVLLDYICMVWSHVKGRDYSTTHVYHKQKTEEYWSRYSPESHPYIHISEPGSTNKAIASKQGDPSIIELLSVIDSQPMMANQAELELKGKVFINPELVIADTNDAEMNMKEVSNNPSALRRRFLYIQPSVKKEFIADGTRRIDIKKSLSSEVPTMDRWNFDVYVMEPKCNRESNIIYKLRGANVYELTTFLKNSFEGHIIDQLKRTSLLENVNVSDYITPEVDVSSTEEDKSEEDVPQCEGRVIDFGWFLGESKYGNELIPAPRSTDGFQPLDDPMEEWSDELGPTWYEKTKAQYDTYIRGNNVLEDFFAGFYSAQWVFNLIQLGWFYMLLVIVFATPSNMILKAFYLRDIKGRIEYTKNKMNFKWYCLMYSYGIPVAPPAVGTAPVSSYWIAKHIVGLTAILLLVRSMRAAQMLSEGLQLSKEMTEEEVDAGLAAAEEASNVQAPPKKGRPAHNYDYDSGYHAPAITVKSVQKNDQGHILAKILGNKKTVNVKGSHEVQTQVTGIFGDYALINAHAFTKPADVWQISVYNSLTKNIGRIVNVTSEDISRVKGDILLVRLRGQTFKDIRDFIPDEHLDTMSYGNHGFVREDKVLIKNFDNFSAEDTFEGLIPVEKGYTYRWPQHARGECGSPVTAEYGNGFGLVGMHTAGSEDGFGYAQRICMNEISSAVKDLELKTPFIAVKSQGVVRVPDGVTGLGQISSRSPLNYEAIDGIEVYGEMEGLSVLRPGKSKVIPTPLALKAEELTGVSLKDENGQPHFLAPPMVGGWCKNGQYCAPLNNFVKKAGVVKESLNTRISGKVISVLTNHVISGLKQAGVTELNPVSLARAQNGDPENFFMRAMKPATSGGYPWPGPKKNYSKQVELDFKKDAYMPLYDVKANVYEQLEAYKRGELAFPLLGAQLKDEPRSAKKVETKSTRVFCMSPYESTLVNRMYLMPFYSSMVEHGEVFGTAIGINMHSVHVDRMVNRLTQFSPHLFEGDYSGYDTSMPFDIGLIASTIVYNVCEHFGFNEEALNYLSGCLSDNMNPLVVLQSALICLPSFQPSGKYATAEDNSLRGLVLLMYAYIDMCTPSGNQGGTFKEDEFFKYILPYIYGDDVLAAIKPELLPYFNNITYQKYCVDVYGLGFTNASKTSDMALSLNIHEASFLKRNFVYREDLGHWVAPLDKKSIMKAIAYCIPSRTVSIQDQTIDACKSALRELFFHLEEKEYFTTRNKFVTVLASTFELEEEDLCKIFPTFLELKDQIYPDIEIGSQ